MKSSGRLQNHLNIDFDLRHLEVFKLVVETTSFSRAARALHMAQPSVSERISNLEQMVGVRLLDRLGRRVVPTKAGELVYRHAVLLLDMKKAACMEIQAFLGLKEGEVHIGGSTVPGEYVLPKLLPLFREEFPSISVRLTIADSDEIQNRLMEGELELGVIGFKPKAKNLVSYDLWKDELLLALPLDHPLSKKKQVCASEILAEPFILRERGSGTWRIIEESLRAFTGKGIESLNIAATVGTSAAVKECVKGGLGVSILSSKALETELKAGILKALRIKDLPLFRTFCLIRDRRRTASPQCQAMLDFLLATAEQG